MLLFFTQLILGILAHELERRHRLWHKTRHADGDLHAAALGFVFVFIIEVHNALRRVGNSLNVLHRLCGQAQHEVELHGGVAGAEGKVAGALDFFLGNVFIDDVPQTLCSGFRRKGKAAFPHPGGFANQRLRKIVDAQRRQRHTHMLFGRPFQHIVQQCFQLAVITGGKRRQRDLIVTCISAQAAPRLGEHIRIPLTHGTIDEARLTKTAAPHAAAQHFDLRAVVHRTDHRHHKILRQRLAVHILNDGLAHHGRRAFFRRDGFHAAVGPIGHIVKRGHVNAFDMAQAL